MSRPGSAARGLLCFGPLRRLHNPSLANRWRTVVAKVPVTVLGSDKYAALAQEEYRFTHVSAPRLGRRLVEIADSSNSGTKTESDANTAPAQVLTVHNPDATHEYGGFVGVFNTRGTGSVAKPFDQICDVSICSFAYPHNVQETLNIAAGPDTNAASLSLDCPGNTGGDFDSCELALTGATNIAVTAHFAQRVQLAISLAPAGLITSTDSRLSVCQRRRAGCISRSARRSRSRRSPSGGVRRRGPAATGRPGRRAR